MKMSVRKFRKFGKSSGNNSEQAALNSVGCSMSQLFSVLMVLFIIAFVIEVAKSKGQIKDAKELATKYRDEFDKVNHKYKELRVAKAKVDGLYARVDAPIKELIADKDFAVEDLQKEILYVQVDRYDAEQRSQLGLSAFSTLVDNKLTFDLTDILSGSKVINKRFIDGSRHAIEVFSDEEWATIWLAEISLRANVQLQENALTNVLKTISEKNALWLKAEITRRITQLRVDTVNLQWEASNYLLAFYGNNPAEIKSQDISDFREEYKTASSEKRLLMQPKLGVLLKIHVRFVFADSGAKLLDDIHEAN